MTWCGSGPGRLCPPARGVASTCSYPAPKSDKHRQKEILINWSNFEHYVPLPSHFVLCEGKKWKIPVKLKMKIWEEPISFCSHEKIFSWAIIAWAIIHQLIHGGTEPWWGNNGANSHQPLCRNIQTRTSSTWVLLGCQWEGLSQTVPSLNHISSTQVKEKLLILYILVSWIFTLSSLPLSTHLWYDNILHTVIFPRMYRTKVFCSSALQC